MKKVILSFILLFTASCGGPYLPTVTSDVTRFSTLSPLDSSQSVFVAPTREQMGDLEYELYRKHLINKLIQQGFVMEADIQKADYVVQFFYGMGDKMERQFTSHSVETSGGRIVKEDGTIVDQFGVIQGLTINTVGSTYTEPVDVDVTVDNYTIVEYERRLKIVMYDNKKSSQGNVIEVYKADVSSEGRSKIFSEVATCLIDAVFTNFYKMGVERTYTSSCFQ